MGHRDSWLVRAGDYIPGLADKERETGSPAAEATKTGGEQAASSKGIRKETVRRIVREELAPVRQELASLREEGVGIRDILGGVGYILGLFGIWAFATSRRNSP
jgi:nickel transport protein